MTPYEMGWMESITWMKQRALNLIQHAWCEAYEWNCTIWLKLLTLVKLTIQPINYIEMTCPFGWHY
jgi:hypothetical protein